MNTKHGDIHIWYISENVMNSVINEPFEWLYIFFIIIKHNVMLSFLLGNRPFQFFL